MNCLLNELVKNPAVESLLRKESSLGNLSLTEEALLYAGIIQTKPAVITDSEE